MNGKEDEKEWRTIAISVHSHEILRKIAYESKKSIKEITNQAIQKYNSIYEESKDG